MFRFSAIIQLHCILIFQIGFGLHFDKDTGTVCDCHCDCDIKIEVVNDDLDEKQLLENRVPKPSSCIKAAAASLKSGIYIIELESINITNLEVFCEENIDSGGWLVIQRHQSTSVNFNRNWHDYKAGFGDLTGNYWIGLEKLHALTSGQELYIQIKALNGSEYYAKYSHMLIANETEDYILKLSYHLGMKFSTYDRDNDDSKENCAYVYDGGWWFNNCYRGYLNGRLGDNLGGVNWHSIVFAQMMIRPNQICWKKLMLSN